MISYSVRSFLFYPITLALLAFSLWANASTVVFINELHYDNTGSDIGEAVEIAGPAGTDLANWRLDFYNGSNGQIYKTTSLSGILSDLTNGMGFMSYSVSGLQNDIEGVALIDDTGTVVQFLSYEGNFVAQDGAALGLQSTDIVVNEQPAGAVGNSLQLAGSGRSFEDFYWAGPVNDSFGLLNTQQSIAPVPLPAALPLFLFGLGGLVVLARRRLQLWEEVPVAN